MCPPESNLKGTDWILIKDMILFELIKQESFILTALPRVEPPLWRFLKCFRMLMIRNTYIALKMTFFPKLMHNLHSRHGPLTHGFAVRQLGAATRTIKSKKKSQSLCV